MAAHAAIAITNARLYEQSRELSILSERNRLALDLHDVVSQKLFSLILTAEAASTLLARGEAPAAALDRVQELAREALEELRSLILGLRPPELERDGLVGVLRKEIAMLSRVHGISIELEADGSPQRGEETILRIADEALHNAVRHSGARRIIVRLGQGAVEVQDDGVGFEPAAARLGSTHLGLTSMEERARELGGRLHISSTPGGGTTVRLEVPRP